MTTITPKQPVQNADYDSPWKEILERYFSEFLAFFFPVAHAGIDWAKGYEFLDKELQKIVRKAEVGRKVVDKLVKVFTTDGTETWLVVHVEVQGQYDADFAKRMYIYNYRLFDRYHRDIVSLAILAVLQYEEEHRMQYVTSFERYGIKKGLQQGQLQVSREAVVDNLQVRFEAVPETIIEAINGIDELPLLKQLRREAVIVSSLEEFIAILDRQAVPA